MHLILNWNQSVNLGGKKTNHSAKFGSHRNALTLLYTSLNVKSDP